MIVRVLEAVDAGFNLVMPVAGDSVGRLPGPHPADRRLRPPPPRGRRGRIGRVGLRRLRTRRRQRAADRSRSGRTLRPRNGRRSPGRQRRETSISTSAASRTSTSVVWPPSAGGLTSPWSCTAATGITPASLVEAVRLGVAKVNYGTYLETAILASHAGHPGPDSGPIRTSCWGWEARTTSSWPDGWRSAMRCWSGSNCSAAAAGPEPRFSRRSPQNWDRPPGRTRSACERLPAGRVKLPWRQSATIT